MVDINEKDAVKLVRCINVIVKNGYLNDREAVDEIVKLFEAYRIDCGFRRSLESFLIHRE